METIRTVDQAYMELKTADPETAITKWFFKETVRNGRIPSIKAGNKYLLRMSDVMEFFNKAVDHGNNV